VRCERLRSEGVLQERIAIDEEYAKELNKPTKLNVGRDGIG
jgi:hypothetical protein